MVGKQQEAFLKKSLAERAFLYVEPEEYDDIREKFSTENISQSMKRAKAMLRSLKLWPILDGVRGRPKLDVEAVADTLVRLSWLAHDLGPRLQDLEINPLIVLVAGRGAVAVDGRGTLV